jgi:outer membrane receptor for ferrienterochelin and colicins
MHLSRATVSPCVVGVTAHLFCLLFLACATSAGCRAQSSGDLANASLQDLLNTEVYSASKHEQHTSDAPSAVTVVTAEEIQKYGYRTLGDILQSVRGFWVTNDRDYSYVGVRGFGRLGDWNSRVLVLVDGHRINDNVLGQAMLGTEFVVDVDLIERVEVIRGPSSSLYGTDAFFAVINVVTRKVVASKAAKAQGLELSFEPASFGTYKGRATYSGQYKEIGLLLSATFYDSAGQTLSFPEFNSPNTNYGVTRNTDYETYQHVLSTITFRGFTLQGLFSARDRGVPTAYFGTAFNDPRTQNFDYHQYLDLGYQSSLHKWEVTAKTSYDQARLQAPLAIPAGVPGGLATLDTYSFRGNWWTGEVKVSRTLWEKHRLTFGTEVRDNLRQDQGDYTSNTQAFFQVQRSSWNWGAYVQDEWSITHKLALSAGLRHDRYSTFGGDTNPRLALVYHPIAPTTLKLLYGTAFRAPEAFETNPGFGAFYESSPRLAPEHIKSVEGVVEQKLGEHFKLSGSVFQNRIDGLISLQNDPSNGLSVYRNSGKSSAEGVEVELDSRFAGGLEGAASYSYTNPHADNPQTLANSPRQLVKFNLTSPLLSRRVFGGIDVYYTGPRTTLAGNTVHGFTGVNGTLLAHTFAKRATLSASVYNIFNRKYFDPGRPEDVQDAIQQDGRSFRVKLTWKFGE